MSSLEREEAGGRLRSAFGRLQPKGRKKPSLGMTSDGAARGELSLLGLSRVVTELERSSRRGWGVVALAGHPA